MNLPFLFEYLLFFLVLYTWTFSSSRVVRWKIPRAFVSLPPISALQELVDDLYRFRDCYFETHSIEDAEKKDGDVTQEIEKTLKYLQEKESERTICMFPLFAGQLQM